MLVLKKIKLCAWKHIAMGLLWMDDIEEHCISVLYAWIEADLQNASFGDSLKQWNSAYLTIVPIYIEEPKLICS